MTTFLTHDDTTNPCSQDTLTRTHSFTPVRSDRPSPQYLTLNQLMATPFPPLRWAVPDLLPEGLCLLCGAPRLGTSWLALDLALTIAAGGTAMHAIPVEQGQVLYLGLQETARRLQQRAALLLGQEGEPPHELEVLADHSPVARADQGWLQQLEAWLHAHPRSRLVVIDPWTRFTPSSNGRSRTQDVLDDDALAPLKRLAEQHHVTILLVHQLRKPTRAAKDVLDEVTSSIGFTPSLDTLLLLKRERGQAEASLFVTGRDIREEGTFALTFQPEHGSWTLLGRAEQVAKTKERQEIQHLLASFPSGLSVSDVASQLQKNPSTTRNLLKKMEACGEVIRYNGTYTNT